MTEEEMRTRTWVDGTGRARPMPSVRMVEEARREERRLNLAMAVIGGAVIGGAALYARQQRGSGRRMPALRDDAPNRAARQSRFGDHAITGRTITIGRPRAEVYAMLDDFDRYPEFMEHVEGVRTGTDGISEWSVAGPRGADLTITTRRDSGIEGESIEWRSVDGSRIAAHGTIRLSDAPGDRGTVVEAILAWQPPAGIAGQALAKVFGIDPKAQARRNLKRLKMLMETGEIATSANRKAEN
jgi:uncharacterized membrane protein